MIKIAVIGAGVNGLTCAVKIAEKYNNFQVSTVLFYYKRKLMEINIYYYFNVHFQYVIN